MRLENWIYTLPLKIRSLVSRRRLERELADELAFYLEQQQAEHRRSGQSGEDATYAARRTFGGLEQSKEQCRRLQPAFPFVELQRDLAFSARLLRKSPGFTLVAIVTLAVGIGANTAVFSLVHAILLRQLPFHEPDRVAVVSDTSTLVQNLSGGHSRQDFYDALASYRSIDSASVYSEAAANLSGPKTEPQRVRLAQVAVPFFQALGVNPQLGRSFTPREDVPGKDHVAILSDRLWRQSFASDPAILGRVLFLNGFSAAVIAVMPPGVDFPSKADLWLPTAFDWNDSTRESGALLLNAIVRLRPGVPFAAAEKELERHRPHSAPPHPQTKTLNLCPPN